MKEELKYRYNQLGVVSDLLVLILVVIAFVLGLLACKAFG